MPTYAPIEQRAGAIIIDTIMFLICGFIIGFISGIYDLEGLVKLATSLELLAVFYLYFIILEGPAGGGQSIGKMIMSIKVTTEEGNVPSYWAAMIRTLLRIVDSILFYALGFLIITFSNKNQRLGDMAAKTIVVPA